MRANLPSPLILLTIWATLVAQYVSAEELDAHVAASDNLFDWITDKDLLDALGRISRSGETPLTKGQMRALKSEIAACLDEDAKIALTPERRERPCWAFLAPTKAGRRFLNQ